MKREKKRKKMKEKMGFNIEWYNLCVYITMLEHKYRHKHIIKGLAE